MHSNGWGMTISVNWEVIFDIKWNRSCTSCTIIRIPAKTVRAIFLLECFYCSWELPNIPQIHPENRQKSARGKPELVEYSEIRMKLFSDLKWMTFQTTLVSILRDGVGDGTTKVRTTSKMTSTIEFICFSIYFFHNRICCSILRSRCYSIWEAPETQCFFFNSNIYYSQKSSTSTRTRRPLRCGTRNLQVN